jgi:hypothetical protein
MPARKNQQLMWQFLCNEAKESSLGAANLIGRAMSEASDDVANAVRKVVKEHNTRPKGSVIFIAKIIPYPREEPDLLTGQTRHNPADAFYSQLDFILVSLSKPMRVSDDRDALPVDADLVV